ncbi:hypothetical protein LTR97_006792 [Elasticomyces elasticus]|uniref:Uncharacterized protein n=1 Tax=Elasticomyces elasticus TaxID=574655 RepID=A0AAN7ZTI1_9PEZI|nr:hypothetical protein LTR97_006792 [Elasticomyces elasticus]
MAQNVCKLTIGRFILRFSSTISPPLRPQTTASPALRGSLSGPAARYRHPYSSTHQPASAFDTLILKNQDPGPNPQKVGIILEELRLPFGVQTIEQEAQQSADKRDSTRDAYARSRSSFHRLER